MITEQHGAPVVGARSAEEPHPSRDRLKPLKDINRVGWLMIGLLAAAVSALAAQDLVDRWLALFWALACFAAGGLVGFVFGVPRTLQARSRANASESRPERGASLVRYESEANTSLEQISDWLTKIIIGLGLVELRELPGLLDRAAARIAATFPSGPTGTATIEALSMALIIVFSIIGFLAAYLLTRMFLPGALDRAAYGRLEEPGTEAARLSAQVAAGV